MSNLCGNYNRLDNAVSVHNAPINNKIRWESLVTVNGESLSVLGGVLDDEVPEVLPGAAVVAPAHQQRF